MSARPPSVSRSRRPADAPGPASARQPKAVSSEGAEEQENRFLKLRDENEGLKNRFRSQEDEVRSLKAKIVRFEERLARKAPGKN